MQAQGQVIITIPESEDLENKSAASFLKRLDGPPLCLFSIIPAIRPLPLQDSDILYLTPCCQHARDTHLVTILMQTPPHTHTPIPRARPTPSKQCSHHLSGWPVCLRLQEEPSDGVCDRCLSGTMHLLCIHVCTRLSCVRLIEMDACTSEHSEKVNACDR